MKFRSFLRKSILIITGFFWASCGEDDSQPININEPASESSSSRDVLLQSSSTNGSEPAEGTSSGTPESSSSAPTGDVSSSSGEQFKLASDTSVTCTREQRFLGTHCVDKPKSTDILCSSQETKLQSNTTLSIEELIQIEDTLDYCTDVAFAPLYGIGYSCVNYWPDYEYTYECSSGNSYINLKTKDGLVYTNDEYDSLFNSSSSEASSSSAAPSPICQKTDFEKKSTVTHNSINEKLDSLTAAGDTVSDNLKKCVNDTLHTSHVGEYAKTQICDGDTTVNPYYQAKLDSIREEVDKAIKDCKAAEALTDSTKTPADSTVTPADSTNTPA